jgi:hypothetical protein
MAKLFVFLGAIASHGLKPHRPGLSMQAPEAEPQARGEMEQEQDVHRVEVEHNTGGESSALEFAPARVAEVLRTYPVGSPKVLRTYLGENASNTRTFSSHPTDEDQNCLAPENGLFAPGTGTCCLEWALHLCEGRTKHACGPQLKIGGPVRPGGPSACNEAKRLNLNLLKGLNLMKPEEEPGFSIPLVKKIKALVEESAGKFEEKYQKKFNTLVLFC